MEEAKKRVFSGIQPTGGFTLGNYIGAIRNWPALQDQYDCLYCVVDQHALTVRNDPAEFRRKTLEAAAMLLACGIDPQKSLLYIQSHAPQHTQLAWILNCYTQFGELSRMTQFKDKAARHPDNVNAGLFDYPVLMVADILLYDAAYVPIGADQRQHLELTRDVAMRFNGLYGDVFTIPEGLYTKVGARIMSLQDPTAKMSKSDTNENAKIMMTDEPDAIIRKFRRAVTDSDSVVRASDDKPGVTNLMSIYGALTGRSMEEIEREFDGRGYGDFKLAVGETVADALRPIQSEYKRILSEKDYLMSVLADSAEKARRIAGRKLAKVARKIGFVDCKY